MNKYQYRVQFDATKSKNYRCLVILLASYALYYLNAVTDIYSIIQI